MKVWYLLCLSLTFKLIRSENKSDRSDPCKDDNNIQDAEYADEKSYKTFKKPSLASTVGDLKIEIKDTRINMHFKKGNLTMHLIAY